MNASPQVGFTSFNSLIRDFLVGFSFLTLIICYIHISNESPSEALKYNLDKEIIEKLSMLSGDKEHEALTFFFIVATIVLSILLGLFVDALGHIFTDNVCSPVHKKWHDHWHTIHYREILLANELISEYFLLPHMEYANSKIKSVFDGITKDKEVEEKLKWLFYSNAPNHTLNARQELWLYYEFYRNIGLVTFLGLCLLVLTPINGFYLKMIMLFFGFLVFAFIARTAKIVFNQISKIEVRFVIIHLLDNKLMQDAHKDSK